MRILQVNSAVTLGGAERHVLDLTHALKALGHEVIVAGRRDSPVMPQLELPFYNSADIYSAYRLRRFLKANRFDIVHMHVARDYPVVAAAMTRLTPKLVATRHLLYPIRMHPFYKRVDGWITPTAQIQKSLASLRPKRSKVIPNWVDLEKFTYRPHAFHRPINLAVLGQVSPHKGHDDAVAALKILGSEYRLLIGGEGERSYLQTLNGHRQGAAVEFLGRVDPRSFFETADVLLAPSWEEPFGIVLLEAMASGIPVIATNGGGPREIIREDVDGVLVPARNPQALAAAVRKLSNDDSRASIAQNARRRVEAEFDQRKIVPAVEGFYKEVLGTGLHVSD
jgi:glycosyltransferase involved in cell wall biosynthesis